MPKVYSNKEYETLKENPVLEAESSPVESGNGQATPAEATRSKSEYVLLHPDTNENMTMGGEYLAEKNGEIIKLPITRGMVKTTDCDIRELLIQKGFMFLFSREIK